SFFFPPFLRPINSLGGHESSSTSVTEALLLKSVDDCREPEFDRLCLYAVSFAMTFEAHSLVVGSPLRWKIFVAWLPKSVSTLCLPSRAVCVQKVWQVLREPNYGNAFGSGRGLK